jgi:tryptophan synthase beta subunit
VLLVNLSGRGDKDVLSVEKALEARRAPVAEGVR